MGLKNSRRRFLGLVGAGTAAGLVSAESIRAEEPNAEAKDKKTFQGTSEKADFNEALGLAIKAAHKAVNAADSLIEWTLKGVSGRDGGIKGFTELTVTIEVKG